jgi:hypothetical protein
MPRSQPTDSELSLLVQQAKGDAIVCLRDPLHRTAARSQLWLNGYRRRYHSLLEATTARAGDTCGRPQALLD